MQLQIDKVIELLRDGKWHTIKEISQKSKIHEFKVEIVTDFLADYSFLELNKKGKKAKLSEVFTEFLKKLHRHKSL
ncbi:MAG: hypothetical protein OEX01_05290 [Candidatus Bathyarchaeota archaeon]|nr:hypothetical protein [Candidatus Bathyarchaeota archaeon]